MKNTMNKLLPVVFILLLGMNGQAQTSSDPVGKWVYSIPELSSEYSTGKAEFKRQNGKLMLTLTVSGITGDAFEMTQKDKSYSGKFQVQGYNIAITLAPDGENMKGTVSGDSGTALITMKPDKTSSDPIGKWTYSVPELPAEYSTGKAEFKRQNDKLMLAFTVNGTTGDPFEMIKKDNSYSGKYQIQGYNIAITLTPDGENLKGTLSSDAGSVLITMKPEK